VEVQKAIHLAHVAAQPPGQLRLADPGGAHLPVEPRGLVGLAGCEDRLTHRLSWGEKKRAALAAVLALGAEILVVDEPAAFLDGRGRRELIALLKDLGGTQIIATHDLALVEALCERVLVLSRGRIVAERTPRELCRDAALLEAHGLA